MPNAIAPEKDVDGLHPMNLAAVSTTSTHGGGRLPWENMSKTQKGKQASEVLEAAEETLAGDGWRRRHARP